MQALVPAGIVFSMKFVSFRQGADAAAGILLSDSVLDLQAAAGLAGERADLGSILTIIRGGDAALAMCQRLASNVLELQGALLPLAEVQLLAPIPRPVRNVFCVGLNYLDHAKESAAAR